METPDPEDEYWHEPDTDDPMWRESYHFEFYDPDADLGYFSTLGWRRHKGYMGSASGFVRDGDVYYLKEYSYPTEDRAIQVGGLVYEPVEPNETWRVRHLGQINRFDEETDDMHLSPKEFPQQEYPLFKLDVNVTFEGIHDPVYYDMDSSGMDVFSNLFDEHSDQGLTVTGDVSIGDETVSVDAMGERDHSWGIRDWRGVDSWRWFSCLFDEENALHFWRANEAGAEGVDGYLHLDGTTNHVQEVRLDTEFREDGLSQESVQFEVVDTEGRQLELDGRAGTIVPIDFEYEEERSTIRRSPTTFESPQVTGEGHGWTEYMTTYSIS